ncbi:MAG TPA: septum formation initiator family protein [Methylomirabilota bacterium]|nr:septum formation initiator family protein [Methylomirabilota bacterium]
MTPRHVRGVMVVAAVALLAYGGSSVARVIQMKREVESLEREIATLREETGRLTKTIDRLRSDPEYIEQLARESLGLVKPGDKVLKLPPSTPGG